MKIIMKTVIIIFLLIISATLYATTYYEISIGKEDAEIIMKMLLESEKAANIFHSIIPLPSNTIIKEINDSKGKLTNFKIENEILTFYTNYGIKRKQELVTINMTVKNVVDKTFEPLYCASFSLPSLKDDNTFITIIGENFISFEALPANFISEFSPSKITISGKGPLNTKLCFSDKGKHSKHFILFGEDRDLSKVDNFFNIVPLILGITIPYDKIPVVVLEDNAYNKLINEYSTAVYKSGGLVIVRKSVFDKGDETAIILHETAHAFNSWAFSWNKSKAIWFDEGIAKTIEFIVRSKLDQHVPNLFYGNVVYFEGDKKITILPNGNIDDLLDYYLNDRSFMDYWDAEDKTTMVFGYSFSELFVRKYVLDSGIDKLQDAYRTFSKIESEVQSAEQFSNIITTTLNTEKNPCYTKDKDTLIDCINNVNNYTIKIPEKTEVITLGLGKVKIEQITNARIKEQEKEQILLSINKFNDHTNEFLNNILITLGEILKIV